MKVKTNVKAGATTGDDRIGNGSQTALKKPGERFYHSPGFAVYDHQIRPPGRFTAHAFAREKTSPRSAISHSFFACIGRRQPAAIKLKERKYNRENQNECESWWRLYCF